MMPSKRLLKCLAYAVLFCIAVIGDAAQEKDATQSSSSVGATTSSSSDTAQFEIAPGIQPPTNGIVWILAIPENSPELLRIYHNNATPNRHQGANFARAEVFMNQVTTLDIPNAAAKLRINSHSPVIFIRKSMEEEEFQSSANGKSVPIHYVLLRMRVLNDRRVLYYFSYAWLVGKVHRQEDDVEVLTEEVAAGQWLKMTPKQPLPDGEYAVVRMPDDKKLGESMAYDFGIGSVAKQPRKN